MSLREAAMEWAQLQPWFQEENARCIALVYRLSRMPWPPADFRAAVDLFGRSREDYILILWQTHLEIAETRRRRSFLGRFFHRNQHNLRRMRHRRNF
jgi:hypothetical protein